MKRGFWVGLLALSLIASQVSVIQADNWWGDWETVRGSGKQAEQTRSIEGVEAVEFGTVGVLYIKVGDAERLTISGDDNLLDLIDTDVEGHTLIIESEKGISPRPRQPLRFHLTVKSLKGIRINSSGDVEVEDALQAARFRVESSSSGDLRMTSLSCDEADLSLGSSGNIDIEHLVAEILEVDINSSGDLIIRGGSVAEQDVSIHSSGDYNARELISETAYVRTSSSGDAFVRATDFLDAATSSSGDVNYYGSPRLKMSENSSGDVRSAGN